MVSSHYLNQFRHIVDRVIGSKLQWLLNPITTVFIQKIILICHSQYVNHLSVPLRDKYNRLNHCFVSRNKCQHSKEQLYKCQSIYHALILFRQGVLLYGYFAASKRLQQNIFFYTWYITITPSLSAWLHASHEVDIRLCCKFHTGILKSVTESYRLLHWVIYLFKK